MTVIECSACRMRGLACEGCVLAYLVSGTDPVELTAGELKAVGVLAAAGLLPPVAQRRVG